MIDLNKAYRNIYIVESRAYWSQYIDDFLPDRDVVLTFDFGLKHQIEQCGGQSFYADSLCTREEMQQNNFLASEFFKKWHYDKNGNDIFTAQGVSFGFAFRIEIWSELFYYVRLRANLEKLRKIKYQAILIHEKNTFIGKILKEMGLVFFELEAILNEKNQSRETSYFFDIHKYMSDSLRNPPIKETVKNSATRILSLIRYYFDSLFKRKPNQKIIYAQIYYPTKKIVWHLLDNANYRVITSTRIAKKGLKKYFNQRLIPIVGANSKFEAQAINLFDYYKNNRFEKMILSDGTDITIDSFKIIDQQIQSIMSESLRILDSVISYYEKHPIQLAIMISNLGLIQTIVDCVLKNRGVPRFLIINGLLGGKFCDEGKYATFINCYGGEIKRNYYNNADNVVCLGDPRMDDYINDLSHNSRSIDRCNPTIVIGASGFNNIDLISHAAIEFDFMFDVLNSFRELRNEGESFSIIIKVRTNGVLSQYKSFVAEYFADLEIKLVREVPIIEVLKQADLYISIYSQTLFEASCLGIPVIYYKKDKEYLDPPFDGKSELVMVDSIAALKKTYYDFKNGNVYFDAFLDKSVMQKYIGSLDGKNLDRNLDFIYGLLEAEMK